MINHEENLFENSYLACTKDKAKYLYQFFIFPQISATLKFFKVTPLVKSPDTRDTLYVSSLAITQLASGK